MLYCLYCLCILFSLFKLFNTADNVYNVYSAYTVYTAYFVYTTYTAYTAYIDFTAHIAYTILTVLDQGGFYAYIQFGSLALWASEQKTGYPETKEPRHSYCQAFYYNNPHKLMPDQTKRTLLKAAAHTGQCTPTHLH